MSKLKNLPDDVPLLCRLQEEGVAFGVVNWNYDDSYLIEYAKSHNAYVITNDRFKDHLEKYGGGDMRKRQAIIKWFKNYIINFSFINGEFVPNPDFLLEHNIGQLARLDLI